MENLVAVVTIHTGGTIPILKRRGPITYPINIEKSVADDLIKLGYDVRIQEIYNPATNTAEIFDGSVSVEANSNPAPEVFNTELEDGENIVSEVVSTTEIPSTDNKEVVEEDESQEDESEITVKSDEELDALEAKDIRNYILGFEAILTKDELNVVRHKNSQKVKLLEIAKAVNSRVLESN